MSPLYVFIHLQKAAGSTFQDLLRNNFIDNKEIFRFPRGIDLEGGWDGVKWIHGHFPMELPVKSGLFHGRRFIYFTLLRNPIYRSLSYYHFAKHAAVQSDPYFTISQWMNKHETLISDGMVKYLGGCDPDKRPKFENLEIAMKRLDDINFGITEYFDESMKRFRDKFPKIFRDLKYESKNVTQGKPDYLELLQNDHELREKVVNLNTLDIQLYEYALTKWRGNGNKKR